MLFYYQSVRDEPAKKKEQNLSNALRNEIVAYMTEGLAQSGFKTAFETWRLHYYVPAQNEHRLQHSGDEFEFEDEDVDFAPADINEMQVDVSEYIDCIEPTPPKAYYPENVCPTINKKRKKRFFCLFKQCGKTFLYLSVVFFVFTFAFILLYFIVLLVFFRLFLMYCMHMYIVGFECICSSINN